MRIALVVVDPQSVAITERTSAGSIDRCGAACADIPRVYHAAARAWAARRRAARQARASSRRSNSSMVPRRSSTRCT